MYIAKKRNLRYNSEQDGVSRCQNTSKGVGWAGKKSQVQDCGTIKHKKDS